MNGKGQALVEFALVLGLLFLLVLGIFEFGRAMFNKNTLNQAARSGARTAVVTPNLTPISMSSLNCSSATNPVIQNVCYALPTQEMKNAAKITLTITAPDLSARSPALPGDTVAVTITWDGYPWFALPRFATNTVFPTSLSGATSMRYE